MGFLAKIFGGSLGIVWALAGPITYIICIIDTWTGRASVIMKLVINLTLDAILAFIWPITWVIWVVQYISGSHTTPLTTVLGF